MQTTPEKLLTFRSGGWVLLLAFILTLFAAALVLYPIYTTGGLVRSVGDGKNVDSYGFDLSNLTLPRSSLIASGNPKDGIQSIPVSLVETITPEAVKLIAANEHIRFLVPNDEVIGLVINGEARAYPLRIMVLHELVNDILGGKDGIPIAITYSPLSDSVVVFDRRIDGDDKPAPEFGNSGLLIDSTSVFFDRQSDNKLESLWPQLALAAVSGPKAGQKLTLIPYTLTTWESWTKLHPNTRVFQGKRTLKEEYGAEPYSTYRSNDVLRFPVDPLWKHPGIPKKTRITATSTDNGKTWQAAFFNLAPPPTPATEQISTSIFAWYAVHQPDTDYSSVLGTK